HPSGFVRFASAARGYRVLVFDGTGILEYDLAQPDRLWRGIEVDANLEQLELRNIEMAADGGATLYVMLVRVPVDGRPNMYQDGERLYLVEGTSPPRRIDGREVSSLWADDDRARLLWQDASGLHVGNVAFQLVRRDALTSVRFRRDAPGFVAAREHEVVTW